MVVEFDKDEGAGEEDLKRVRVAIVDSFFFFLFLDFPPYPVLSGLLLPTLFFSLFDSDQERKKKQQTRGKKAEEKEKETGERKRI